MEINQIENMSNIASKWDINKFTDNLGNLQLKKTIATGGQGKVKLGKYYNKDIIVKVLHKLDATSYTTEVMNTYKYRHPNIPKLFGVFESSKHYGIVIEYVDGVTLTDLIHLESKEKIKLPLIQKLDYLVQLASVIEFLHAHSLLHRDLKTDNIIIDRLGNLKLIDFGIAIQGEQKWINMESPEYSLTPSYMAPEIAQQAKEEDEDEMLPIKRTETEQLFSSRKSLCGTNNTPILERRSIIGLDSTITKKCFSYTKTIDLKDATVEQDEGKWLLITNKYDVWTFGVIMAQILTRCKPWCKNKNECLSEGEITTRLVHKLPYPINTIYPIEECQRYHQELREILKKCLEFDFEVRPPIKVIKEMLLKIFFKEVISKVNSEKLHAYQKKSDQNKQICSALKKCEISDKSKKDIVRFNKVLMRKQVSCEAINRLNQLITEKEGKVGSSGLTAEMKLLSERIEIRRDEGSAFSCNMLDGLKRANLKQAQKLKIMEHTIAELTDKCEILEKASPAAASFKSLKSKSNVYMTYDDFNQCILLIEFYPERNLRSLPLCESNNRLLLYFKKVGYRSPACLNYDNKLYFVGGLVFNKGKDDKDNSKVRGSFLADKEAYSEVFGSNYLPTNDSYCFDYNTKDTIKLPQMKFKRVGHSMIIFRSELFVIGGSSRQCESLKCPKSPENVEKFNEDKQLVEHLIEPLLVNFNDMYILAMQNANDFTLRIHIMSTDRTWKVTSVNNEDILPEKVLINSFSAIYYNMDCYDNDSLKVFLFATCTSIPEDDIQDISLLKQVSKPDEDTRKLRCLAMQISFSKQNFEFSRVSFRHLRLKNMPPGKKSINLVQVMNITQGEPEPFCIHNTNVFYEYDEDLYYFTMDKGERKIEMKSIDMSLNKII